MSEPEHVARMALHEILGAVEGLTAIGAQSRGNVPVERIAELNSPRPESL
jgi:hypothetical protein